MNDRADPRKVMADIGRSDSAQGDPPRAEGALSLREIVRVIGKWRWPIVAIVAGINTVFGTALFMTDREYTSHTSVLVEPKDVQLFDITAALAGERVDAAIVENQVQILRSRVLAERVIDQLGLMDDAYFNRELRPESGGLLARIGLGRQPVPEGPDHGRLVREAAIKEFLDGLRVRRNPVANTITISYVHAVPARSAEIANAIAEMYLDDQLEAKFEATKRASEWLTQRLDSLADQVRTAEQAVADYKEANQLIDIDGRTQSEQEFKELTIELADVRSDLELQRANLNQIGDTYRRGGSIDAIADVLASPIIVRMRQEEVELNRREAELSSTLGDRHPEIQTIRAQRNRLAGSIRREIEKVIDNLEGEIAVAADRADSLESIVAGMEADAAVVNQKQIRLRELERQADASRTIYETFLTRFTEQSDQEAIQEADARIISKASIPTRPSHPRVAMLGILSICSSVLLALGGVFLLEFLDRGFPTLEAMENSLGIVALGLVPRIKGPKAHRERSFDYLVEKPFSAYAEAIRNIRTGLLLSDHDHPPRAVMVTSALPNEGKSTLSISLARMSAISGGRTLLIDADLRRTSIHRMMGLKPEAGLKEVLDGKADVSEAILTDPKSDLALLSIKGGTSNPPDMLGSDAMRRIVTGLRDVYDLILIDTPPVLVVSDARVLAGLVDATVMVVQWDQTPRNAARGAVKDLINAGARIAGTVMTQVDLARQVRFGHGDSASFYGKYQSYYTD